MDNGVTELDKLCHAHQQAAEEEKKAKARRLEIEGLIVAISDVKELRPVKTKVDIDLPKLRAIENANPELFKLVCNAIATKPAKTSIKVEVLS